MDKSVTYEVALELAYAVEDEAAALKCTCCPCCGCTCGQESKDQRPD